MDKDRFFNKKKSLITIEEIIRITNCKVDDNVDLQKQVNDIATLENATEKHLSFVNSGQYLTKLYNSNAGFCFGQIKFKDKVPKNMIFLEHDNPYFAYSLIANYFYEEKKPIFNNNLIDKTARIGNNCQIAPNSYIGKNVEIGDNCIINPNVTILEGCKIGDNCIINSGAVLSFLLMGDNCIIHNGVKIGQDGFGFAYDKGVNHKIIQIGIVEIGNNVEIGANSCVDRGAIENTIIKDGVKIDNLVQIAHNVIIDQGSVMAGCSAIAGSTKIGKFVQIGGGASVGGHIEIGDGAKIAGMSGVMRNVKSLEVVGGIPAIPIRLWHKINAKLTK